MASDRKGVHIGELWARLIHDLVELRERGGKSGELARAMLAALPQSSEPQPLTVEAVMPQLAASAQVAAGWRHGAGQSAADAARE
jgi:hypothetical protein